MDEGGFQICVMCALHLIITGAGSVKSQWHSFCTERMCSLQTSNRLTSEMRDPDSTRDITDGHQVSDLNLQIGGFDPGLDNFSPAFRDHRKLCKDRMDLCMQGLIFQNRQTSAVLMPTRPPIWAYSPEKPPSSNMLYLQHCYAMSVSP